MSDEQNDDAPDIPPALSQEEWASRMAVAVAVGRASKRPPLSVRIEYDGNHQAGLVLLLDDGREISLVDVSQIAKLVALSNDVLRVLDDPRAILGKHVTLLRSIADGRWESDIEDDNYSQLHELADALASYLNPETANGGE